MEGAPLRWLLPLNPVQGHRRRRKDRGPSRVSSARRRPTEVEMKMVKSLLLGTAAGLVAVAGAQAADYPVKGKAAAVQYVKICSLYGDGFYYIPGTDTCLKMGAHPAQGSRAPSTQSSRLRVFYATPA